LFQTLKPFLCSASRLTASGRGLSVVFGLALGLFPHLLFGWSDSDVEVRLKTPLTSYRTKPGVPFECVVLRPWISNGLVMIPEGSTVHGHVARATTVGLGLRHERAKLDLVFDDFVTPDGHTFPLHATLDSIDNAREQVKSGVVRGVLAAGQPNELIFGMWSSPSVGMVSRTLVGLTGLSRQISSGLSLGPLADGGLLVLRLSLFRFPEPEIQYAPGADMNLKIVDPAVQQGVQETPPVPLSAPDSVSDWLANEPFSVDRRDNRPVGDIVNLAFLGSRQQLEQAFSAAGWARAEPNTGKAKKQTYYAFNAMRAYATAPVSPLFYKGTLPEMVFEKSLNTITKRHHIRVWYAGVVDGQELWLGAATHDTGGTFRLSSFKFTHKIDPNVDKERDKVVTDLRFAGCAEPEMHVDRPAVASNGLDRNSFTDGSATVLSLTDCEGNHVPPYVFPKPGNMVSRLARRMILEARNHLLRENPYYWSYEIVKHTHDHVVQSNNQNRLGN